MNSIGEMEEAITEPGKFVVEFFDSVEKAGNPLKKREFITYDIECLKLDVTNRT